MSRTCRSRSLRHITSMGPDTPIKEFSRMPFPNPPQRKMFSVPHIYEQHESESFYHFSSVTLFSPPSSILPSLPLFASSLFSPLVVRRVAVPLSPSRGLLLGRRLLRSYSALHPSSSVPFRPLRAKLRRREERKTRKGRSRPNSEFLGSVVASLCGRV